MQAAAQDRGQRPPFGFADDPSAEAEAIARRVAEALAALQAELTDARCGCSALGLVCDVLPRMPEALAERGVALGSVVGVWAVPAAVLDTASRCSQSPWPSVRQRLKPYLAFDLWLELQDDVFAGKGVDWGEMALSEASVVVVKHTLPLRAAGSRLAREAWVAICSGRLRRAVVIAARQHLHRRRMVELAAWAWPFRWAWLLGWVAGMTAVVASRLLAAAIIAAHLNPPSMPDTSVDASHQPLDASLDTSTQPPVASPGRAALAWRELVGLFLANLTLLAYAIRGRAPYAMAMGEAVALKKSGTVALRLKDAAAAAQQYTAGARRAGELRGEGWWWLNGRAVAAADTLRAACWNNAAAAHLQQNNWAEAEAAAAAALGVPGLGSAAAAKARYRRAVARASVRDMDGAREDLLIAESLAPGDRHVDALVRMLQLEQARSKAEGGGGGGGSEPTASPNSGAMPLPPSVGGVVSSAAAPAAGDGVRAGAASRGGAAPVSGDGAALTLGVTVAPVQKFRWAKDWFEAKLTRLGCTDEDGAILVVTAVRQFRGEAWIRTTPPRRARPDTGSVPGRVPEPSSARTAHFDLSLAVEWQATVGHGAHSYTGTVTLDDISDANDPETAYEVQIQFEPQPKLGTEEEAAVLNLIGPLAPATVAGVEGKLGRMLWERVMLFRHEFQRHADEGRGEEGDGDDCASARCSGA